jgi:hypothetical protein
MIPRTSHLSAEAKYLQQIIGNAVTDIRFLKE